MHLKAAGLVAIAACTALWWLLCQRVVEVRTLFFTDDLWLRQASTLRVADISVIVCGGFVAATLAALNHPWRRPAAWLLAGALLYGTAVAAAWFILDGAGPLGFILMAAATAMAALIAARV